MHVAFQGPCAMCAAAESVRPRVAIQPTAAARRRPEQEAFGIARPRELWGTSLLPLAEGQATRGRRAAVLGNSHHAQVMTERWLCAVWRGQRSSARYGLKEDPWQTRNMLSAHPQIVACAVR